MNIQGALNIDTLTMETDFTDSINSDSVLRLMDQLYADNPKAETSYIILDNAAYNHRGKVEKHRQKLGNIKLLFWSPYSPNLNLIERVGKFFKKKTLYNKYHEKFNDFRYACLHFFDNIKNYKAELPSLLNEKFHLRKQN
jgi:transposase